MTMAGITYITAAERAKRIASMTDDGLREYSENHPRCEAGVERVLTALETLTATQAIQHFGRPRDDEATSPEDEDDSHLRNPSSERFGFEQQ